MVTRVQDGINDQINNELASSYLYLSMSAWCATQNFLGSAAWLRSQSAEENMHAMKLLDFLIARGGTVTLAAIPKPVGKYGSVVEIFEAAYKAEQEVTRQIDHLYEMAHKEKAFAAVVELQWFVTEQVEEEKTAREIVAQFNMVKNDPAALLELDRELASRGGAAKKK